MTAIHDLAHIEVEHGLGLATGKGFVKLRVTADADVILLGQLPTDQARQIAGHLLDAAARAEYEQDFAAAMAGAGFPPEHVGQMLTLVRLGEIDRHIATKENPDDPDA